jgi:hypothetical protein
MTDSLQAAYGNLAAVYARLAQYDRAVAMDRQNLKLHPATC